jgi:hypothetical protein
MLSALLRISTSLLIKIIDEVKIEAKLLHRNFLTLSLAIHKKLGKRGFTFYVLLHSVWTS